MDREKTAHIELLRCFDELPFAIGKKTLVDFVKGNPNKTIEKNNLEELNSYGSLYYQSIPSLFSLINQLIESNYLEEYSISQFRVIRRTPKGRDELVNKKFVFKENDNSLPPSSLKHSLKVELPTDKEIKQFKQFDFFLKNYNDEQKKAILSTQPFILCIAGAGTGKTSVLVKRIDALTKLKSVNEKSILAITFTRKAREEMLSRLNKLGIKNVDVETFNSFCEKILKKNENLLYSKTTRVVEFKDKITLVRTAMDKLNYHFEFLTDNFFSKKQLREKSRDELFFSFVHTIFSILDHYKNSIQEIKPFYTHEKNPQRRKTAEAIYNIVIFVEEELGRRGLRDFSDQGSHCLELFSKHPEIKPSYEHILVDEFQDVNAIQLELIFSLKSSNIFCVGDPRQAIYGWRGSQIQYILDFPKYFPNAQILGLTKNYRSSENLVSFSNKAIESLSLPVLEATLPEEENNLFVIEQESELLERIFVVEAIKNTNTPYNEIFILGRTNKIVEQFTKELEKQKIPFAVKSEEDYSYSTSESAVTIATIHSIKGMEATEVYLVGVNANNFPNKVQDNYVISLVKIDDTYDKESEELRLFYVGITRAKKKVVLTYTSTLSKFVTNDMLDVANFKPKQKSLFSSTSLEKEDETCKALLKSWRMEKANQTGLPAYMILSNASLDEIARTMPSTKDELEYVKGLGPMKVAKFGEEILQIINGK